MLTRREILWHLGGLMRFLETAAALTSTSQPRIMGRGVGS
jgi:hypothetical protein